MSFPSSSRNRFWCCVCCLSCWMSCIAKSSGRWTLSIIHNMPSKWMMVALPGWRLITSLMMMEIALVHRVALLALQEPGPSGKFEREAIFCQESLCLAKNCYTFFNQIFPRNTWLYVESLISSSTFLRIYCLHRLIWCLLLTLLWDIICGRVQQLRGLCMWTLGSQMLMGCPATQSPFPCTKFSRSLTKIFADTKMHSHWLGMLLVMELGIELGHLNNLPILISHST